MTGPSCNDQPAPLRRLVICSVCSVGHAHCGSAQNSPIVLLVQVPHRLRRTVHIDLHGLSSTLHRIERLQGTEVEPHWGVRLWLVLELWRSIMGFIIAIIYKGFLQFHNGLSTDDLLWF